MADVAQMAYSAVANEDPVASINEKIPLKTSVCLTSKNNQLFVFKMVTMLS